MEAKDLRSLSVEELKGRVRQWGDELFRSRFKAGTSETKDTSIFRKLRRDIARAHTVINEKVRSGNTGGTVSAAPQDQAAPKKAATKRTAAAKKTTEKSKE